MFFTIQFPIADSRKFIEDNVGLLAKPNWPTPTPDYDFIRHFGTIRQRKRGGLPGWIAEGEVCEANRALRIKNQSDVIIYNHNGDSQKLNIRVVFRRLYCDGFVVGKYEVGLMVFVKGHHGFNLDSYGATDLLNYLLNIPVIIPQPNNIGKTTSRSLINSGREIANLYSLGSTSTKFKNDQKSWWVSSQRPAIFIESKSGENIHLPFFHKSFPLHNGFYNLDTVNYYLLPFNGQDIPLWLLNEPGMFWDDIEYIQKVRTYLREIRITLLRLHAERECLRKVLENINSERISIPKEHTKASDALQTFINESISRIRKIEKHSEKTLSFNAIEIAQYLDNLSTPGTNEKILKSLINIRRNIYRKLIDYLNKPIIYIERNEMKDTYINPGQAQIFGHVEKIESSNFIQSWNKISSFLDFNQLAKELAQLKEEMQKRAETPEQEMSIGSIAAAEKAAISNDGPKVLEYFKNAGKWAIEVATQIGIGLAIKELINALGI